MSSDVCPVIKVSDIAVCHRVVPCWTLTESWGWGVGGGSEIEMVLLSNTYLRLFKLFS